MNEEKVKAWITKAESDLKIGKDEIMTKDPATDAVAFHMQQCVEKYLKAFLTSFGVPFRRTHDLTELINQCTKVDPEFKELFEINADKLTAYSIDVRYPDDFYTPSLEEAKEAIEIAEKVKSFVIRKLKETQD